MSAKAHVCKELLKINEEAGKNKLNFMGLVDK